MREEERRGERAGHPEDSSGLTYLSCFSSREVSDSEPTFAIYSRLAHGPQGSDGGVALPSHRAGVPGGPLGAEPQAILRISTKLDTASSLLGQQRLPGAAQALQELQEQHHRSGTS